MSEYIRSTGGQTYFFTVVTFKRRPILCREYCRKTLKGIVRNVVTRYPFRVDACILLPDHIHTIWTLPEDDLNYSRRWSVLKRKFTKCVRSFVHREDLLTESRKRRKEGTIWQRRFWEHQIRDQEDFNKHCDYIHYNAVKHGLVNSPKDWPFSTFHELVRKGIYEQDWGSEVDVTSIKKIDCE